MAEETTRATEITEDADAPIYKKYWSLLYADRSLEQRRILVGAAVTTIVAFAFIIVTAVGSPEYEAVARGLAPEDQQAATMALEAKAIPYKLDAGGTILVHRDRIHEAHMELATSSLPSGRTVGFELFDESELGRSTFNEKINYHRALEGELARTIQQLDGVERVRVHLVTPERRLFQEDEVNPTASVHVSLAPGIILNNMQVRAIQQLVGSGVERMNPKNVHVVDQTGKLLGESEDSQFGKEKALSYQTRFEKAIEHRVVALLEPVFGRGHVVAQVSAELDFSHVIETEEKYDPDSQVIRSEREQAEENETKLNSARGVPGSGMNLPDRAQAANANLPNATPVNSTKLDHVKNYEIDKRTKRRETPHPRVKRLSVGVVIDALQIADEEGEQAAAPSSEELDSYRNLIARAVGIDASRGDALEVVVTPFLGLKRVKTDIIVEPTLMTNLWFWSGLGGFIGLLALMAWLVSRFRRRRTLLEEREQLRLEEASRVEAEEAMQYLPEAEPELREVKAKIALLRRKAVSQCNQDVKASADVLRRWIRDSMEAQLETHEEEEAA